MLVEVMHAEICAQPAVLRRVLETYVDPARRALRFDAAVLQALSGASRLGFTACGSSLRAAAIGRLALEELAALPSQLEIASELVGRALPGVGRGAVQISVSQSGATADTLAAMHGWRARGGQCLSVVNVADSPMAAVADWTLFTHAGLELAIPSTKGFTSQVLVLVLLALGVARRGDRVAPAAWKGWLDALEELPGQVAQALQTEAAARAVAQRLADAPYVIFLGRGVGYPLALEGALKLKESACVPAEGYAAAEFRHGPAALVRRGTPVVVLAPGGVHHRALLEGMARLRQEGAFVVAIGAASDVALAQVADAVIGVPCPSPWLASLCMSVPLQWLAYHAALARGLNPDTPPNLVKSLG